MTRRTDGVFRELTNQRVALPWIEASRRKGVGGENTGQSEGKKAVGKDRKLEPKRMKDSYHSVVCVFLCMQLRSLE